jgi:hypothetical protein
MKLVTGFLPYEGCNAVNAWHELFIPKIDSVSSTTIYGTKMLHLSFTRYNYSLDHNPKFFMQHHSYPNNQYIRRRTLMRRRVMSLEPGKLEPRRSNHQINQLALFPTTK